MHEEFKKDGLVVLALSNETPEKVEPYVAQYGLPFPVASGSQSNGGFSKLSGARGIPHSYLINHEGTVVWHGHPSGLSNGTIKDALKGAPKLANAMLALPLGEAKGALGKALAAAASGKLGDAMKGLTKISTDDKAEADVRAKAAEAIESIDAHVTAIMNQIEKALERRDVLPATEALEMIASDLKGQPAGARATERLAEVEKDETFANELDAAKAYQKAMELGAKRGMKKARGKFEALIKKFPGTRAADQAKMKLATM